MNSFLLVQSDPKQPIVQNLRAARAAFQRKFSVAPNTFFVHPSQAPRDYHVAGIHIVRKHTIMPHTLGVARQGVTQ